MSMDGVHDARFGGLLCLIHNFIDFGFNMKALIDGIVGIELGKY